MSNLDKFEFDVPALHGFSEIDYENEDERIAIESYFDNKEDDETPFVACSEVEAYFSPLSTPGPVNEIPRPTGNLKKSMSTSCLVQASQKNKHDLSNQMKKMNITANNGSTRQTSFNKSSSTNKLFSNENLYQSMCQSKNGLNGSTKYMSSAEMIYKFQNKTPARFHKGPIGEKPILQKQPKLTMTIPQSPALATKKRHRFTSVLSTEEKEIQEFNEAQMHKFKANPLNAKILNKADAIVTIKKKSPTKVKPFNITEVPKKVIKTPEKPRYEFHARPIPEAVIKPTIPQIKAHITTQAITPSFVRKHNEKFKQIKKPENKEEKKQPVKPIRLMSTVPIPFSFEKRDVDMFVKKEQKIQKVYEEEKKLKEFHARPVPKKILESPTIPPKKFYSSDSILSSRSDDADSNSTTTFKARPASVLKMKPFIPKKAERPLIEIANVQLNSEQRAQARARYEQQQKEREKILEELKLKRMEEERKKEEEEIKKIRKQSEYFAQPIRKYRELKKVEPKPLTTPNSPKFASGKSYNKENTQNTLE